METTKEDFIKMLKGHDWYYQFSDDHRYWSAGNSQRKAIQAVLKDHPEWRTLYDEESKKHPV
jgi:uncharacterized ParB-like nuclease family protein